MLETLILSSKSRVLVSELWFELRVELQVQLNSELRELELNLGELQRRKSLNPRFEHAKALNVWVPI